MNLQEAKKEMKLVNNAIEKIKVDYNTAMETLAKCRRKVEVIVDNDTAQKYIGKCYRFPNSYGSPDSGWTGYVKVIGKEEGYVVFLVIQKTSHDEITIETRRTHVDYFNKKNERWTSTKPSVFNNNMKKMLKEIGYEQTNKVVTK